MRKLSYDLVKKCFEDNGCILLDNEYKNNRTKIKFICRCGETYSRNFDNFEKWPHCRKCGHLQASKKKAFTQENVSQIFINQNCELKSEYKDCKTPLCYKCECGETSFISLDNFKKGKRCKKCGVKKISGDKYGRWIVDREKVKLAKLFRKKCYKSLSSVLRVLNQNKKSKTQEILGYSPNDLQDYIIKHPNWNKVKLYRWHLDHIFPIQAFIDYGISNIKLINRLDNLQPLIAKDNLSKSDDYCKEEFEKWLKSVGAI